jgi:uncharacterized membrane protein
VTSKLILFLSIFFLISQAYALTSLNIYLDESGDAIIVGTAQSNTSLPDYLTYQNGKVTGITSELTSKNGDLWAFDFSLNDSYINVILPEGAIIQSISNFNSTTVTGSNELEIIAQDSVSVSYTIQKPQKSYFLWLILALVIILLILVGFYLTKFIRNRKNEQDKLEIIKKVLNDREKLILDTLKKSGKIKSSHLRKLTDLPKATFSRYLTELAKKKLIILSGDGKNKFVSLKN